MLETEPLIQWPQPLIEILGFVAAFLSAGALGFRYAVLGRLQRSAAGDGGTDERALIAAAAACAAAFGLAGAMLGAGLLASRLPELAARRHLTVAELVFGSAPVTVQVGLVLVAIAGFALALAHKAPGWPLAAFGMIAGMLRAAFFGQWARLVNPMHELAGGMWTHLKVLSALWTTPYGYALIAKLCVVLGVVALGAWNWRRQKPRLGSVESALALRRSARAELVAASLVLAVTAILVSLPSPKPPLP